MTLAPPQDAADLDRSQHVQHFDVLIVGAGLSGICAAYYLQKKCPAKTFAILEGRRSPGGTWDLFRYPGIRSDSDLYTFGFSFSPWRDDKAIADGPSIMRYLKETIARFGIGPRIRFGHSVQRASWDSQSARWTVDVAADGEAPSRYTCSFLYMCTGYYDYGEGYMPVWPHMERFKGKIVHPQNWPQDLEYAGRRVAVIGSGATAVTLVPELASEAAHVTMVQRSPTYIVTLPAKDRIANWLRRGLPERAAHALARWKNILLSMYFYNYARVKPAAAKKEILRLAKKQLPPGFDVERHLKPRYNPWDQRLCLVPDGDLFKAIRKGRASIATGEIEAFTEKGIRFASGGELEADIIVTATGLKLKLMGGMDLCVDGKAPDASKAFIYKGMMFSDIPNFAYSIGYTNASWTLKCELIARYVCRILNHMDARGYSIAVPRLRGNFGEEPAIGLTSGYIQRAVGSLPRQGTKKPWKLYQNYVLDLLSLKFGTLEDGAMEFTPAKKRL